MNFLGVAITKIAVLIVDAIHSQADNPSVLTMQQHGETRSQNGYE
jgi:hypothetical protein